MQPPQRAAAGVVDAARLPVAERANGPVLARIGALQAALGVAPRRPAHGADGVPDGPAEGGGEAEQKQKVEPAGQQVPQAGQREGREQRRDAAARRKRRPQPLPGEGQPGQDQTALQPAVDPVTVPGLARGSHVGAAAAPARGAPNHAGKLSPASMSSTLGRARTIAKSGPLTSTSGISGRLL